MLFMRFELTSSGGHFVGQAKQFLAILVEGIMGNIPVKLF